MLRFAPRWRYSGQFGLTGRNRDTVVPMASDAGIPRVPFNEAKANLSAFVSDVVRRHQPRLLERGRGDPEGLLAMPVEDLVAGLAACRLDARVNTDRDGSVVARLPQFGLVTTGKHIDSAIDALHDELLDYCEDFFGDFDFYRHTDRVRHLPFLLRFALTSPDARRALLLEEPAGWEDSVNVEEAAATAR
jgi:hypothetical protein